MTNPIAVAGDQAGQRLDQFLAFHLKVSRARVQELIHAKKILLNDAPAKASIKLRGGERIAILGPAERPPLRAVAEAIPLDIVYEDEDLAIINKPAGMMVHAGAGVSEDVDGDESQSHEPPNGEPPGEGEFRNDGESQIEARPRNHSRNRGTLVNALLHHFASLSAIGGELRPGIVHRLDKETSGLIVVAKNDESHRRLAEQFARREVKKTYIALVHGWPKKDRETISASISRDRVRRTRMTTRLSGGREAISHYRVITRMETPYGKFSLIEVKIDTGRTHQIRVHMASLGHPIIGDKLYGARAELKPADFKAASRQKKLKSAEMQTISLSRNFLHAAELALAHPRTGTSILLKSPLPPELLKFLAVLETVIPS
jgi:23S rRNA pseudouridine1911/1915/1917 synthase